MAAGLCLALGAGIAAPALAGPVASLQGLFGHRSQGGREGAPPIGRYVSEDGDVFTFDRTGAKALLKFDSSFEVWALQPQQAPRGDTIYKNDLGEPVLRATRLGGITIFTEHRPDGEAAALAGPGAPLRLPIMGSQAVIERLAQASFRASHALRRLVPFAAEGSAESSALMADAALVTSEAMVRMARRSDARKVLDKIAKVRLVEGRKAGADLTGDGILLITVATPQGLAGRPSSDRIQQVAQGLH